MQVSLKQFYYKFSINEEVELFTQIFQNVISNYIPHDTMTCDDRNPPWIDERIKN